MHLNTFIHHLLKCLKNILNDTNVLIGWKNAIPARTTTSDELLSTIADTAGHFLPELKHFNAHAD
ncbi:hypothetical protein T10_1513 [Trichinella papuae]|uniref:Uncharacterized protein n=1 Tax=Trichinella papuae TaxID=268474 RepID=A0A0V1MAW0_9BILA|nr:hypothetical protein T10_1513 [Trichinella papuae]